MKISYTDHALKRLSERGISADEVRKVLNLGKKKDIVGGLRQAEFEINGRILIVRYNIKSTKEVSVVTVFPKD